MFKEYYECPNCSVERVDPSDRDDDVRTVIEQCDYHREESDA